MIANLDPRKQMQV